MSDIKKHVITYYNYYNDFYEKHFTDYEYNGDIKCVPGHDNDMLLYYYFCKWLGVQFDIDLYVKWNESDYVLSSRRFIEIVCEKLNIELIEKSKEIQISVEKYQDSYEEWHIQDTTMFFENGDSLFSKISFIFTCIRRDPCIHLYKINRKENIQMNEHDYIKYYLELLTHNQYTCKIYLTRYE